MIKLSLEDTLCLLLKEAGFLYVDREYKFHPKRKWRFDFAFPRIKLAIECEGGVFGMSRHTSPMGFINDCEKYNAAACLGWTVLRFACNTIRDGSCIETIKICYDMKMKVK